MKKQRFCEEYSKRSKRSRVIKINLSLLIGIITIFFLLLSSIVGYKVVTIETEKLESFEAETSTYGENEETQTSNDDESYGLMLTSSNIYSTIARSIYCSGYSTSTGTQVMTAEYWTATHSYYVNDPNIRTRTYLDPGDRVSSVFKNLNNVGGI